MDDLAREWLGGGQSSSTVAQIDELTTDIDVQLGELGRSIRSERAKAKERQREREEAFRESKGRLETGEEQMVRRMVARALVRSEKSVQGGLHQRRLLDEHDVSALVCRKSELLLARVSQYVESVEGDTCCICLDPLKGGVLRLNTCGHHFHFLCLLKWFEVKQRYWCPLCKSRSGRTTGRALAPALALPPPRLRTVETITPKGTHNNLD